MRLNKVEMKVRHKAHIVVTHIWLKMFYLNKFSIIVDSLFICSLRLDIILLIFWLSTLVRVFQETFHYKLYTSLGWGAPVIMTSAWAVTLAVQMKTECWWGYNLSIYFWILEGPRFAVVIVSLQFIYFVKDSMILLY